MICQYATDLQNFDLKIFANFFLNFTSAAAPNDRPPDVAYFFPHHQCEVL